MFAEIGVSIVVLKRALEARLRGYLAIHLFRHFGRYNPRRHGDYAVAENHDEGCQHFAKWRQGNDISVSNRGQRHDRPIN